MFCALFSLGVLSLPHNSLVAMEAAGAPATPEKRSPSVSVGDATDAEAVPALALSTEKLTLEEFQMAFIGRRGIEASYTLYEELFAFTQRAHFYEEIKGFDKLSTGRKTDITEALFTDIYSKSSKFADYYNQAPNPKKEPFKSQADRMQAFLEGPLLESLKRAAEDCNF